MSAVCLLMVYFKVKLVDAGVLSITIMHKNNVRCIKVFSPYITASIRVGDDFHLPLSEQFLYVAEEPPPPFFSPPASRSG